jgi:hypothetical protein
MQSGEAKWLPGLPTTVGWFMIKEGSARYVIRVDKSGTSPQLYYWDDGQWWPINKLVNVTNHCPVTWPTASPGE